jgi:hypothetical protein
MALSKEEAQESQPSTLAEPELPKYAYGLRLELDDDALEKLGITELPAVGETLMITAKVEVIGTSTNERQGGDEESCVSLQITHLAIGDENEPKKRDPAKALYKSTE